MEKITKREMFECLLNMAQTGEATTVREDGTEIGFTEEMLAEFAQHEMDLLDKKAESAKKRAAEKKSELDELGVRVRDMLTEDELQITADIVLKLDDENATVGKVQSRLKKLVDAGVAVKEQITVKGEDGAKARKLMAYKLAPIETAE